MNTCVVTYKNTVHEYANICVHAVHRASIQMARRLIIRSREIPKLLVFMFKLFDNSKIFTETPIEVQSDGSNINIYLAAPRLLIAQSGAQEGSKGMKYFAIQIPND